MGFLSRLFGKRSWAQVAHDDAIRSLKQSGMYDELSSLSENSSTSAKSNTIKPLPMITEMHLHRNYAYDVLNPIPGDGGKKYEESTPAWNNGDYKKAFNLISEAIELGLEDPDIAGAHFLLGLIYIKQCQLEEAIDEFLMCLKARLRLPDTTWETAMRLYYIYSEAGESRIAKKLLSLAEDSNSRLDTPRIHDSSVETEIRELTRQQITLG